MSENSSHRILSDLRASLEAEFEARPQGIALLVDRRTRQWHEVAPESLWRIERPGDLEEHQLLVSSCRGELRLAAPVRYGFTLNWIGEAAPGKLAGHLGVPTDVSAEARVDACLSGAFLCAVWREDDGRLRLSLQRQTQSAAGFTARAAVSARGEVSPHEDELVAAIVEAHPLEWLEAFSEKVTRGRAEERLARFFQVWNSLESRAAAAIWKAAGDVAGLSALRRWVHRLAAEIQDAAQLRTLLESEPPAAGSAVESWIEAAAGSLLSAVAGSSGFQRLLAAAEVADRLLSDEALVLTLGELKRQAAEKAAAALAGAVPQGVRDLVASVGGQALEALQNKYSAELSYLAGSAALNTALVDCSFDFSEAGLKAYRAMLAGDLTAALEQGREHVHLHLGVLTHGLCRHSRLELQLPFLDRKQWSSRLEVLAGARIETTLDGRLMVYSLSARDELARHSLAQSVMSLCGAFVLRPAARDARFSLAWSDARRLTAAQARSSLPPLLKAYRFEGAPAWLEAALADAGRVEAELALSVPGEMVAAWLEAPVERSPNYGPVYTEVSVAVQQAMRTWLPYVYFSDLSRYDTLAAAYPLVVYQCTLPFRTKAKNEFAYDVMSAESVAVARRSTGWALGAELARIEQVLREAGKAETARFYRPSRKDVILAGVERAPRLLNSLLVADALFIDHLIQLGRRAGGLRRAMEHEPQRALRELAKFGEEFVKTFHRRLRRLYGGQDFAAFGALILLEATCALNAALRSTCAVSGICRLRVHSAGGGATEQIFVSAYRRP